MVLLELCGDVHNDPRVPLHLKRAFTSACGNRFHVRPMVWTGRYISTLERGSNRGGKYDHGEQISLPVGKSVSSKQVEEIAAAIHQRQEEVATILEEETTK